MLPVLYNCQLGSTLSLRSFARMGSAVSVLAFAKMGSSLSLRSFARLGSALSLFGVSKLGSRMSVFDCMAIGSSLSVRSFVRLGSSLTTASAIAVPNKVEFTPNTYMYYNSGTSQLEWYVGGASAIRVMSMDASGGELHGTWTVDGGGAVTSDRRLKRDVKPLKRTLREVHETAAQVSDFVPQGVSGGSLLPSSKESAEGGALWTLRQLRPVSYYFKKGSESKYMRFGFIADDLESVLPQVVRTTRGREFEDQKGVMYTDLIALLASAAQGQQQIVEQQQDRMDKLLADFATLKTELQTLKQEDLDVPKIDLRGRKKKGGKGQPKARATETDIANATNGTNASNATNATAWSRPSEPAKSLIDVSI